MTFNKIENLSKLVPLGGVILILLSIVKTTLFFDVFNIQIAEFVTISEFLIFFLQDILLYTAIFLIWFFVYLFFESADKFELPVWGTKNIKAEKVLYILGILLTIGAFIYNIKFKEFTHQKFEIFRDYLMILLMLSSGFIRIFNSRIPFSLYMGIILIVYTIFDSKIKGYKLIEEESHIVQTFDFKDEKIITDKDFIYIGKSNSYIFFYDKCAKGAIIKPANLNEVSIKN